MKILIILSIALLYSLIPTLLMKKIWEKGFKNDGNKIMLTFDDGPDPIYTTELLDLLLLNNIKASFFVVTNFAKENPNIINRMIREGHSIGLHSTDHTSSMIKGPIRTRKNLIESINSLEKMGIDINYYRPPWGQLNIFTLILLKLYNKKLVLWNVMAEDWELDSTVNIIEEKLLDRVESGSIICLHDGRGENDAPRRTIEALKNVIPKLIDKKYEFITVGEYYGK